MNGLFTGRSGRYDSALLCCTMQGETLYAFLRLGHLNLFKVVVNDDCDTHPIETILLHDTFSLSLLSCYNKLHYEWLHGQ
jgi:hypothetical protein